MKANDIPERLPERRHKDNLIILTKIFREIDRLQWNLVNSINSKKNIIDTYLYDMDEKELNEFYTEYNEFIENEKKCKAFKEKYNLYE